MVGKYFIWALCFITAFAVNEDRVEEDPPRFQMSPKDLPTLRFGATPTNCQPGDVDLVFVVDGSGSIGRQNFETVKAFLKNIVTGLEIESANSRVGFIQFTTASRLELKLSDFSSTAQINQAIENVVYMAGGTYIAGGMNRAIIDAFSPANGERPDITNVMIVLTDGRDGRNQDVIDAFNAATRQGDTVIAVGVGRGVDQKELSDIAGGDASRIFDVAGFNDLNAITGTICQDIQDLDPCSPDPCNRHGNCMRGNGTQDYVCDCEAGYSGDNCQISVCQNDGTFKCICPFGYTGPTCGEVIDFCNGTQILHDGSQTQIPFCGPHGKCQNTPGGAACVCDPDWTGVFCDENINDCASNPCLNNGTCVDDREEPGYKCICPDWYQGVNCQNHTNFCADTPVFQNGSVVDVPVCQNGGTCHNSDAGAVCSCPQDWSGVFCEQNVNDCLPNPCLNNGTCVDSSDGPGYKCYCPDLYEGVNCENHKDYCVDTPILQNGSIVDVPICQNGGLCQNTPGGALCICQSTEYADYTGTWCETELPKNCTWKNNSYPHNSTWVNHCDSCACIYGVVECADSYWCPQRCALYTTPSVTRQNISTTCPPNMNCIPDNIQCAKPVCDLPIGWCFPVGMVMVDSITFPTNPPNGYQRGV